MGRAAAYCAGEGSAPGRQLMRFREDNPKDEILGAPGAGRAAVSGGMSPGAPDILGDLEFLEHHWGSAYLIGAEDAGYTAVRRDGKGAKLAAPDRDSLVRKIATDYTADPVSRDLP